MKPSSHVETEARGTPQGEEEDEDEVWIPKTRGGEVERDRHEKVWMLFFPAVN